ncbi:glutamate decarboxylase [Fusarium sporotrichioides]|uniref:glutamate decarboxylase n=1 Tax=Fusarium sporotrichioides TaxID=5514 RepID=A0A395S2U8_FUSSP|nr:glutamate decarboxylase [Fusarium sporotrichioides]
MDPRSYQSSETLFECLPIDTLGNGQPASVVKSGIDRLLEHDIEPEHNLGSFVSTGLNDDGERLLLENYKRNLACQNEYAGVRKIHDRCVEILGAVWGSSCNDKPTGCAASGSSEAIFLGILAMKRKWQTENGGMASLNGSALNLITGSHAHVAVTNAAKANDIEIRSVPVSPEGNYSFDPSKMQGLLDSFTRHFDPIENTSTVLDNYEQSHGHSIPIHVDAASGGFVAPFNGGKCSRWDFSVPRVVSINASGHKFGLTAAALGWIIWRDQRFLSSDMLHESSYLSGHHELPTLRYSQPSSSVLIQYYYLAHLGRKGFENIIQALLHRSSALSRTLEGTGIFTCISESHRTAANTLPVVVFRVNSAVRDHRPKFNEQWISDQLFHKGYSVPCSKLPIDGEDIEVLRVVVILVDKAVITSLAYDHVEIAVEDKTGHLHIRKYEQYYKTMYET